MNRVFLLSLVSASLLAFPLCGEVFELWPWKGGGTVSGESLAGKLPGAGKVLHAEKMQINGVSVEMKVSAVDAEFSQLLAFLAGVFKPENIEVGGDTVKVAYKVGNEVERWLLVNSGPGKPVTMFLIVAPEKLPSVKEWPAELPAMPKGAVPNQVIRFPERKAVYGSFRNGGDDPASLLRELSGTLRLSGWTSLGDESEQPGGGTGGIFLQENPRRILWVSYGAKGIGSFYSRPY